MILGIVILMIFIAWGVLKGISALFGPKVAAVIGLGCFILWMIAGNMS